LSIPQIFFRDAAFLKTGPKTSFRTCLAPYFSWTNLQDNHCKLSNPPIFLFAGGPGRGFLWCFAPVFLSFFVFFVCCRVSCLLFFALNNVTQCSWKQIIMKGTTCDNTIFPWQIDTSVHLCAWTNHTSCLRSHSLHGRFTTIFSPTNIQLAFQDFFFGYFIRSKTWIPIADDVYLNICFKWVIQRKDLLVISTTGVWTSSESGAITDTLNRKAWQVTCLS
jgi:hypothetical protein